MKTIFVSEGESGLGGAISLEILRYTGSHCMGIGDLTCKKVCKSEHSQLHSLQ